MNGLVDRYNGLVWSSPGRTGSLRPTPRRGADDLASPGRAPRRPAGPRARGRSARHDGAPRSPARAPPRRSADRPGAAGRRDGRSRSRVAAAERDQALWKAFGGLSERCQTLLRILVADPPPSYDEVGAALDMPIGSIGKSDPRAVLERLRGLAEGEGVTATDRRGHGMTDDDATTEADLRALFTRMTRAAAARRRRPRRLHLAHDRRRAGRAERRRYSADASEEAALLVRSGRGPRQLKLRVAAARDRARGDRHRRPLAPAPGQLVRRRGGDGDDRAARAKTGDPAQADELGRFVLDGLRAGVVRLHVVLRGTQIAIPWTTI